MYDIALGVFACVRAGTAAHVAWVASGPGADPAAAVAFTPGGGRMGELLGGALDQPLRDEIAVLRGDGTLVELVIGPAEALISELPEGTRLTVALVAGSAIPEQVWTELTARRPVAFALDLRDGEVAGAEIVEHPEPGITLVDDRLVCSLVPVPRVVVAGSGPIADALVDVFGAAGWSTAVAAGPNEATGMMATLAGIDAAVVLGHDVETSSRALQAALASGAGYIGSIGSRRMQELREEWLSYRGVEWSDRVHGPAGLPIDASTPGEIAVSVAAEAIGFVHRSRGPGPKK